MFGQFGRFYILSSIILNITISSEIYEKPRFNTSSKTLRTNRSYCYKFSMKPEEG